jgi:hypothetical protein
MRTKALLGLAALAIGLSTSVAQNVYSLNVVGYVNVSLQQGKLHFLSVPLAPTDGNFNITNTVNATDAQTDASLFRWVGTSWDTTIPQWYSGYGWFPDMVISNGVGFFLVSKTNSTLTFVGEVPQGAIPYNIPAGLSTLANKIPVSTNFPGLTVGNVDDTMFTWDQAGQKWANAIWQFYSGYGWDAGLTPANADGPFLNPADAVFYVNKGAAIPFTKNFTVQ